MTDAGTGVLVMAYGTPGSPDEVEGYYTHIRRGRPPTPEQLADLRRRYDAIGGVSPLASRTRAQVAGIAGALQDLAPGNYRVALGMKHAAPFIEDAAKDLVGAGCERVVGLVLAPHFSALSVGEYHERAGEVVPDYVAVDSWHLEPDLIRLLAARVREATVHVAASGPVEVIFTAHSLPERVLSMGDPYPAQLEETAAVVAASASVERWRVAWQSAGRTPEPWLGPDVLEVLRELPSTGAGAAVVCPAGFVSDHLEVLYDLDIEARAVAEEAGLAFARTASLNDEAAFTAMLGRVVHNAARGEG